MTMTGIDASQAGNIKALLAQDDLSGALALMTEAVRHAPQDLGLRLVLIDLLILSEDWERADNQARMASTIAPNEAVGLSLLRREIRGMHARTRWYEDAAVPDFPDGPTSADQISLRLALALRENDGHAATEAFEALSQIQPARLCWNGGAPGDFRDLDDRLPHALEAVTTGGAYLWIDFSKIARIDFAAASRPRDLAFRPAQLRLLDGSSAEILVPALYYARGTQTNAVRLGRETGWTDGPGGIVTGYGQRCFFAGEAMVAIAEANSIVRGESIGDG